VPKRESAPYGSLRSQGRPVGKFPYAIVGERADRARMRVRPPGPRFQFSNSAIHKHSFAISPRISREFCCQRRPFLKIRGRRESRVARCTRSLACKGEVKHTSVATTGTTRSTGFPRAMVLTVSFVLSPVTGLFCHRHPADNSARLDASVGASGPHDFAVASVSFVRAYALILKRPSHPAPNVRDDREAPLLWEQDGGSFKSDLGLRRSEIFFAEGLDRIQ
jgi:hypothetical protein